MKKSLMDILACPMCKHYPLNLHIFEEKKFVEVEVVEGSIVCEKCARWYPIIGEVPHMLPDEVRDAKEDSAFLEKWREKIPKEIRG